MIKVRIDYERKEYLNVIKQFASHEHKTVFDKWHNRFLLGFIGSSIFMYKHFKIGICDFEITERSIMRMSKLGILEKSWDDIGQVLELRDSYLIKLLKGGAMPLPKRVLTSEHQCVLKSYAGDKLVVV